MLNLADLPVDLLIDHLLPCCDALTTLRLSASCRAFRATVVNSSALWKSFLARDFNFPLHATARETGYYDLYRRVARPELYVFGAASNGRLGISERDSSARRRIVDGGLPEPHRLLLEDRVVDIVSGGWSFHALTSDGEILFWGTLNGDGWAPPNSPLSNPNFEQSTPRKLDICFPSKIVTISSGRAHAIALDDEEEIFAWWSWGRIARLRFNVRLSKVYSAIAGWSLSAILCRKTNSTQKTVLAIHSPSNRALSRAASSQYVGSEGYEVDFVQLDLVVPTLELPPIPDLGKDDDIKQIAAGDHFIVALTSSGRVYKIDLTPMQRDRDMNRPDQNEDEAQGLESVDRERLAAAFANGQRTWIYLPEFCDMATISRHAIYNDVAKLQKPKSNCRISHISAHFQSFCAYAVGLEPTDGIVLLGDRNDGPESTARIIPELQGTGVIKVAMGDYHFGALTSEGQMLTWGQYSSGALGHGRGNCNIPNVTPAPPAPQARPRPGVMIPGGLRNRQQMVERNLAMPTAVNFQSNIITPHRKFIFNIALSGWHSAALAVDLDHNPADSDSEEEIREHTMPGSFTHNHPPQLGNTGNHQRIFNPRNIRLGYPARGIRRAPQS